MGLRNLEGVTRINVDARNPFNMTQRTLFYDQKMSNLCVYFAILSALRHEMKNLFKNFRSTAINFSSNFYELDSRSVSIPGGKSIEELYSEKEFDHLVKADRSNFPRCFSMKIPNALSFERMLAVLLGCVSPRALSVNGLYSIKQLHSA